jgi:uncharacterized protein YdaU (DUF1376 family)
MAAKWQLWMPLYIDRWKGSAHVQAMRAAARAGYLYLLTAAWQTEDCSLPPDDDELAILSGLPDDEWTEHKDKIRRQFTVSADGRVTNAVLKAEWTKAKQIFESRQSNALRTHSKRKAGDEHKQSIRKVSCNADTGTSTGTVTSTEKPENTLALTALAVPADVPFITMPLNNKSEFPISAERVQEWQALYPAIDVRQELRKYKGWADANPTKRKTRRGILTSVNSWLAKSHDNSNQNGGINGTNRSNSVSGRVSPAIERQRNSRQALANAVARRYGIGVDATVCADIGAVPESGVTAGHAGYVSGGVGETGAEVRTGGVHGRTIEGH